jgi:hypothetical protein
MKKLFKMSPEMEDELKEKGPCGLAIEAVALVVVMSTAPIAVYLIGQWFIS